MSLEREFLFISVRHSSHLILPGIRVPCWKAARRGQRRVRGWDGWRKITFAGRRDGNGGAKIAKLRGIFKYWRAPVEESLSEAIPPSNRQRDASLGNASDDDAGRSKLQRFNKSIRPRGGVKSLTGNGMGRGRGGPSRKITISRKKWKKSENRYNASGFIASRLNTSTLPQASRFLKLVLHLPEYYARYFSSQIAGTQSTSKIRGKIVPRESYSYFKRKTFCPIF